MLKARLAATAFDGEGARQQGGRWNSPGVRIVYAAQTLSLAVLEVLVHLQDTGPLEAYVAFEVEFDASLVEQIDSTKLPVDWRRTPAPVELQAVGDDWVASGRSAALRVPSAIVPEESTFLLNPVHADFPSISIGAPRRIELDSRLTRRA